MKKKHDNEHKLEIVHGCDHCAEICPHDDMDDFICLDCGADRTEELSARAYDQWKDRQKYGDA